MADVGVTRQYWFTQNPIKCLEVFIATVMHYRYKEYLMDQILV